MAGHLDLVDPDATGAAFGVGATQPQVVFTAAIHLAFESSCEILDWTTHGLRVSVWCISYVYLGRGPKICDRYT